MHQVTNASHFVLKRTVLICIVNSYKIIAEWIQ